MEFYCSLATISDGCVSLTPEFGSRKYAVVAGWIDFFISDKRWGIEITRDGQKLGEHNDRFLEDGAYGEWLQTGDMEEYILIDFRMTVPDSYHPSMCHLHLFHI
jgi:hypothetical protein